MATLQQEARALGDPTRHTIFRYIAGSREPVDVAELTDLFGVNHNAIRQHLSKLLEVGLVVEHTARPGRPGRPRLLYELAPGVESRWGVTGPYERLSLLLAEVIRTGSRPVEVGRRAGRAAADQSEQSGDRIEDVATEMTRQGFDPEVRRRGARAEVVLHSCPFATAASADPDTVCELHLGIAEGLVEGTDTVVDDLVRKDPRRARLPAPAARRAEDVSGPIEEGGDPACWAHLFVAELSSSEGAAKGGAPDRRVQSATVQEIVAALAEQHRELAGLLDPLPNDSWELPSRCPGWSVADVVLHLAQTDELALGSVTGEFAGAMERLAGGFAAADSVDGGADAMVAAQRGASSTEVRERWRRGAFELRRALAAADPSARVPWVVGDLAARTLATTRLAESWIHTGDVLTALGRPIVASDRLRHIVRLAWRTLPYAFAGAGQELSGPVELDLTGPTGEGWDFVPEEPAATIITGSALDLCHVAGQRADAAGTSLAGTGPDASAVLELIRTFA